MPGLTVDERFCMGCHACEVACKQEHGLPEGPRMIRVDAAPEVGAAAVSLWRVTVCRHCDEPACVETCPENALVREGGLVRVRPDLCTGCRLCADACDFGVPQFHPDGGLLLLCDLCPERTSALGRPACVHHCPAGALGL